ncbi:HTH-type transcriptional repressor KstR2 [Rhodobacteraceae bacterium THAF1]|uniref:TetR/AcrR family transcriptional regulator n=1 Tax=Palleronia sp. THAF1 TaxID=2587842 RepID=UPI000F40AC11|nr:TetR/AcrR family transcriptional regulator [Palleronia sp. THAF1]QFU08156.1 HTH-type transcriptional repressor KstR2 [Palleronia sp. THAF1]VDC28707.1 HTH-type transcriptional repressor KstR2 [Rhodobacteraceae bacterium THAF1]
MALKIETKAVRKRMAPEDRREAILDAAQSLFTQRGWEAVTIADVLDAAEISKGGFYHHFTAKEDLLTGIVMRSTEHAIRVSETARREASGNALAKFNAFVAGSVRWKTDNLDEMRLFTDVLAKPGNDILYRRIFDATAEAIVPVLEDLVSAGIADGSFNVADARLTAEVIVGLLLGRRQVLEDAVTQAATGNLDQATRLLNDRMQAEGAICDRLLGLPEGSVILSSAEDQRRMLIGLTPDRNAKNDADAKRRLKEQPYD